MPVAFLLPFLFQGALQTCGIDVFNISNINSIFFSLLVKNGKSWKAKGMENTTLGSCCLCREYQCHRKVPLVPQLPPPLPSDRSSVLSREQGVVGGLCFSLKLVAQLPFIGYSSHFYHNLGFSPDSVL